MNIGFRNKNGDYPGARRDCPIAYAVKYLRGTPTLANRVGLPAVSIMIVDAL
jgi:hypothetical protein